MASHTCCHVVHAVSRPAVLKPDASGMLQMPEFDWCVLKLGHEGYIREFDVDTNHFKGNFPESCRVEGVYAPDASNDAFAGGTCEHAVVPWSAHLTRCHRVWLCVWLCRCVCVWLCVCGCVLLSIARGATCWLAVDVGAAAVKARPQPTAHVLCSWRSEEAVHTLATVHVPGRWNLQVPCVRISGTTEQVVAAPALFLCDMIPKTQTESVISPTAAAAAAAPSSLFCVLCGLYDRRHWSARHRAQPCVSPLNH